MSVTATVASTINCTETFTGDSIGSNNTVNHTGLDKTVALTSASTPPITLYAGGSVALSGGAKTLDLTALAEGTNGGVIDATGLKCQVARFENPSTNANTITVKFGASNPYLLGGAGWTTVLSPGQYVMYYGNDATPDVAAGSADEIDFAGTAVQPFKYEMIFG